MNSTRTHSAMNAYDGVPSAAEGEPNGNLKDDGIRLYQYDAFNRLLVVKRKRDRC